LLNDNNLTAPQTLKLFNAYVQSWQKKFHDLKNESKRKRTRLLMRFIQKITNITLKDLNTNILNPINKSLLFDLTYAIHKYKSSNLFLNFSF
jgi:hypothetical protein